MDEAAAIGLMAQEVVGALGAQTLAKGLAAARAHGHRMPSHLVRSARALDSAASFLRHPGAAAAVAAAIRAWVDKEEFLPAGDLAFSDSSVPGDNELSVQPRFPKGCINDKELEPYPTGRTKRMTVKTGHALPASMADGDQPAEDSLFEPKDFCAHTYDRQAGPAHETAWARTCHS